MSEGLVLGEQGKSNLSIISRITKNPYQALVFLFCLINISLIVVNIGLWIIAARQKLFTQADFTAYYTGYSIIRSGEASNLYDLNTQYKYQRSILNNPEYKGGLLPYINPPHVALIFSPLSFLALEPAFYLWTIIQLGLLIWLLFTLNRLFSGWSKNERMVMLITILAFWPLINTFLLGQFSIILVIAILQMYICMKNARLGLGGLCLVVLSIKPQALFIPSMLTINKRYWRIALTAMLSGLMIFAASILLIGVQPWIQYIPILKGLSSYFGDYGIYPTIEYTLRGILSNVFGEAQVNLTNIISIIFLLLGMLTTWSLWKNDIPQDASRFDLLFSFSLLLTAFLSLHMNPHDSLILILPAALLYDYLRKNGFPIRAFTILMLVSPTIFFIAAFNRFNLFGVIRLPVIIILAIFGWMINYLVLDHRKEIHTANNMLNPPGLLRK